MLKKEKKRKPRSARERGLTKEERGMNIKIDENSAAAQGGQSDRLVINSFRVSPRRRCDEKGGERGLSVAPSPPPFFSLLCSRGIGGKSACLGEICRGGGGRSVESRANRNDFETSQQPIPPSMRVEYVEYVENGATTSTGEERGGEGRPVHSYTVIDRSYPCFRAFVNSN